MDRSDVRDLWCRIVFALAVGFLPPPLLEAQEASIAPNTFSVLVGGGWSRLSGGPAQSGAPGLTVGGVAYARQVGPRVSMRAELVGWLTRADLGRTGIFEEATTVGQNHLGLGLQLRRGVGPNGFVGIGGTLLVETGCDIDLEGGPGFLGGETVPCGSFEETPLVANARTVAVMVSAGIEHGRLGFEARVDQGLGASLTSPSGGMTPRRLSLVLHYALRRWA